MIRKKLDAYVKYVWDTLYTIFHLYKYIFDKINAYLLNSLMIVYCLFKNSSSLKFIYLFNYLLFLTLKEM